eukprot:s250_g9.t1
MESFAAPPPPSGGMPDPQGPPPKAKHVKVGGSRQAAGQCAFRVAREGAPKVEEELKESAEADSLLDELVKVGRQMEEALACAERSASSSSGRVTAGVPVQEVAPAKGVVATERAAFSVDAESVKVAEAGALAMQTAKAASCGAAKLGVPQQTPPPWTATPLPPAPKGESSVVAGVPEPSPSGDVVITHLRSANRDPKPDVLASAVTKRHIKQGSAFASSAVDPWQQGQGDPWARPSAASFGGGVDPAAADRLHQIEHRLQSNVQDLVRKELGQMPQQMECQDDGYRAQTDARFAKIEAGMTEMQAQQVKFEGWFAQLHQIDHFFSGQLEQTNQRLDQVNQNVTSQVSSLQQNMTQIQSEVSAGYANIEALLSKRGKTS